MCDANSTRLLFHSLGYKLEVFMNEEKPHLTSSKNDYTEIQTIAK